MILSIVTKKVAPGHDLSLKIVAESEPIRDFFLCPETQRRRYLILAVVSQRHSLLGQNSLYTVIDRGCSRFLLWLINLDDFPSPESDLCARQ